MHESGVLSSVHATSLIVAGISGGVALVSLTWQIITQTRKERRSAKQLVRRYKDPLVLAADQLVTRIRNISERELLQEYPKLDYVATSTAFAVAELLYWMEIVREEQQFLDLGAEKKTRRLNEALREIARALSTDSLRAPNGEPALFMLNNPADFGHLFRRNPDRCSGRKRTRVPGESGHAR